MHFVVIIELSTALLKILDLVETCISNLRRKTTLNLIALDVGYKYTGSVQATDVLL